MRVEAMLNSLASQGCHPTLTLTAPGKWRAYADRGSTRFFEGNTPFKAMDRAFQAFALTVQKMPKRCPSCEKPTRVSLVAIEHEAYAVGCSCGMRGPIAGDRAEALALWNKAMESMP